MEQTKRVWRGRRYHRGEGREGGRGGWRGGGKGGGRAGDGRGSGRDTGSSSGVGDGKGDERGTGSGSDSWRGGRSSGRDRGRVGRRRSRRGCGRGTTREDERAGDSESESLGRFVDELEFKELQELETKTPEQIVLHLTSSRRFPATEYLMKQHSKIPDDYIVLIVSVLTKACDCSSKEDQLNLLNLLPGSSFINSHLRQYLNKLFVNTMPPSAVLVFLKNVVQIMNELLRRFPNSYTDLPLSDLYCAIRVAFESGQVADETLLTDIDEIMQMRIQKDEELKRKEEEKKQRRTKPRRNAEDNDDVYPPENFLCLSVIPTQEDILTGERPFLRRNKVDGRYEDAEQYLDVQFRLLREDFMRPLREGIAQLLERTGSVKIGALQDILVYNDVRLLYPVCTSNGIRYKIKFANSKLRHVRWENSKRLIFGSLLCLSADKFENIVFATVVNRELPEIKHGIVDIQFINPFDNVRFEEGDVYQMVESTSYFEAYRHVLKGLQEISPAELPFKNYIVNCQEEVEPPVYLRNRLQEQVTFDLTPIIKKESRDTTGSSDTLRKFRLRRARLGARDDVRKGTDVPILNLDSWPSAEDLDLDDSQFRALQMALTKEFAVIQGPPGTGKTYIGLKIANVLLHNKRKWDSDDKMNRWGLSFQRLVHHPILVVCYTNHALDQFLEGIHQFHPEGIVRIGGRSQSETMKACSLSELKHKMHKKKIVPQNIRRDLYEAHRRMEDAESTLQAAADGLKKCCKNVLHEDAIRYRARSMTEAHYHSLKQPFVGIVGQEHSAMLHWLNLSVNSANPSQGGACKIDGGENTEAEPEIEEEDKEEKENVDNRDVLYEANVMEDQRVLLDDDDVRVFNSKQTRKKEQLKVVKPFTYSKEGEDEWQIQNAHRLKKKLKRIMNFELSKKDVMSDERAKMVTDVWSLSLEDRWRLYRRWVQDVRERYRRDMSFFHFDFERGVRELKQIKSQLDLLILKKAAVIGMTTTGAAKYREILAELRPRITIVEEAAEVLESHIVTSLTPGCQHLILIGDHQQLRPNPTVYALAKDYNLDVSLFERMVKNGMPFERLRLQHRMRPEISKMLEHIYFNPKLENHESVLNFENIKGVTRNVFFVDHAESEDFLEEGRSRSNEHEAKFMAALCRYFILQGYEREKITVLTAYVGQLTQLKKEMPTDFFGGVRVCAVDNFQGEENDIILLSLVRSNEEGKIGFLQTENRVCVALSRAKKGFFSIGNFSLLAKKSTLWNKIISDMRDAGNVGNALTLTCQNHPENVIDASHADDFKKAPEGGCTVPCASRLECGHVCDMMCHPTDPEHEEYKCKKPCTKTLCDLNHKCPRRCYQECGPCLEPFEKILPRCGHLQEVPCYLCKDLSQVKCKKPCNMTLNCGHPCTGNCSDCIGGRVHVSCKNNCDRTLFCGHNCSEQCAKTCPPCKEKCGNYCKHNKCTKRCCDPCDSCSKRCVWQCEHHRCTKSCGELCDRPRCNVPCTKLLLCQHPCIGLCGEPCPKKCRECHKDEVTEIFFGTEDQPDARFVELADCGHVFEVEMMDHWMDQADTRQDGKPVDVHLKLCPKCRVPIRTSLRYGNIVKKLLTVFEQIKRHISLNEAQRSQEVANLLLAVQQIDQFPSERRYIEMSLGRANHATEQIDVIKNQINFLSFLQTLKANTHRHFEEEDLPRKTEEEFESKVKQLLHRVMALNYGFSCQELEELNEEMYRTQLFVDFRLLIMQLEIRGIKLGITDTVKFHFIKEVLDSEKKIDKTFRDRYTARIQLIRREQKLQVFNQAVPRDEEGLIVKAKCLPRAHWLKCPRGHIYCITDCGEAMEESKCPDCG